MSRDSEEGWSSEYDSTWEEDGGERPKEPGSRRQPTNCRKWMSRAARDLQNYRHGYAEDKNYQCYSTQPSQTPNLDFYLDKRPFEPDGMLITQLLERWKGKYDTLERNHSYIQWLFPLREYGMNSCAKPLTIAEMETMKKDTVVKERFLAAYKLMLDFYGIKLENEKTGKLTRADNWECRFKNLNDHSHNNLRITRILKCLGELGYKHFQAPLVKFFLEETLCNGRLQNVKKSALDYFMFTVKDKKERRKLVHFAWKNSSHEKFIWGPAEKLRSYQPPPEDEHEAEIVPAENEEESKINGQLESPNSENAECQQDSFKLDKIPNEECIPLTNRSESKQESPKIFPNPGSIKCSKAVSDDKGLPCIPKSHNTNGVPLLAEDEKSDWKDSSVSHDVSPNHDHEVPSAVGPQDEDQVEFPVMDGTENLQQDNAHRDIAETPKTPRKRKWEDRVSKGSPPLSNENVGPPKTGEERMDIGEDNSKLKKLDLKGQPGSERNKMADDPPSSGPGKDPQRPDEDLHQVHEDLQVPGKDPQRLDEDPHGLGGDPQGPGKDPQRPGGDPHGLGGDPQGPGKDPQRPGGDSDINQEGGLRSQMECKAAKEEIPKLLEPSNSENKEVEYPSTSGTSNDPK